MRAEASISNQSKAEHHEQCSSALVIKNRLYPLTPSHTSPANPELLQPYNGRVLPWMEKQSFNETVILTH